MENRLIAGLGELLYDVFPSGVKQIGGAPVNFAYHLRQMGFDTVAVSAVGKDALGDGIMDFLKEHHLKNMVARVDYPTGTVQVELDGEGVPHFTICEGVAWDYIPLSPELLELARKCSVLCFGTLAQRSRTSFETVNAFIDAMPVSDDALRIYDINLRQHYYSKELIENSLRKSNVLKINDDEFRVLSTMLGYDDSRFDCGCRGLMARYGLGTVILTCGAEGSYIFTEDDESFLPTPHVDVVDTVGAGDSFTAAFTASILRGRSIHEAHRRAVDVAAYVCTQSGAMPVLPDCLKD